MLKGNGRFFDDAKIINISVLCTINYMCFNEKNLILAY